MGAIENWLYIFIAVIGIGIAVYQFRSNQSRVEGRRVGRLMGAADELGMKFIAQPDWGIQDWFEEKAWVGQVVGERYAGFWPFLGVAASMNNLIVGSMGELEFEAFECDMIDTDGEGKPVTAKYFFASAAMPVHFPGVCFGDLKEWRGDKVLTELPEFNRVLPVRSEDAGFAHGLAHPEMMEFLLKSKAPFVQIGGRRVVLAGAGELDAAFVLAASRFFTQFWDLVPGYMKEDYRVVEDQPCS